MVVLAVLLGAPLLGAGCVDVDSGDAGGAGGSLDPSGSGGVAADGSPKAPFLDTVAALHGALHLFWTNETLDCDEIQAERSLDGGAFEVIFSVAGDVEDEADDSATDPDVLYTYRLRCRKGALLSPYSNEDARSPKPPSSPEDDTL